MEKKLNMKFSRASIVNLTEEINRPLHKSEGIKLWWLGQAGFAIRSQETLVLIDPYLSDSLADKYLGRELPHKRMMALPVKPQEIKGVTAVLCSHGHSDHMDPRTLPALLAVNPKCTFIVPKAEEALACERGLAEAHLQLMDDNDDLKLGDTLTIHAIPSAHESLEKDTNGHYRHLGFILNFGKTAIYHSGDCAPYPGLEEKLTSRNISLALLPVNGRDTFRFKRNILGNFTFNEAVGLCDVVGIPYLIAHHFGMFDFNTVDPEALNTEIAKTGQNNRVFLAETKVSYSLID